MNRSEGTSVAEYEVDYSEVVGRKAECLEGCGLCCMCQPEVLPLEKPFFQQHYPEALVRSRTPEHYQALALKKGRGSCVFLKEDRHCRVYDHRTAYCRQFPYHIYVSDRVKVELDLSCRGLWTGKGNDALTEAKALIKAADDRIRKALPDAARVYREFYGYCREAGVMKDPSVLRMSVSESLDSFTDPGFLSKVLAMAELEPQMSLPHGRDAAADLPALEEAARGAALESISSDDPLSVPIYSSEDQSWNVFMEEKGVIEWMVADDQGEFHHRDFEDTAKIPLRFPDKEGRDVLADYIRTLNGRDSFMGSAFYLVDANGYEDDLANAYYGCLATAVLDVMWRACLLDRFFHTGLGARGLREAIIFYDMDRLDAPAIGAFV